MAPVKIGIVGAGMIGGTVGRLWLRAGHQVRFGTRHPEELQGVIQEAPTLASAGTAEDAAAFGDVVLLAVPLAAVPGLGPSIAPFVAGKVVLDASNPYPERDGAVATEATAHPGGCSAWVASHLAGAHVVKTFNTVYFRTLEEQAHRPGDGLGITLAGDDPEALATAAALVRDAGFAPVVVGALVEGRRVEPGTPTYNTGMSASELALALGVA
jgi:predicted dinucleotide-binding enzyme